MKLSRMDGPYGSKYELLLSKEEFQDAIREYLFTENQEIRELLQQGKTLSIQLDDHTLGTNHKVKVIIK